MSAAAAATSPWGMDTSVSLHAAAASAHSMTAAASYYSHHPAFLPHHHPTAREFREAAGLQVGRLFRFPGIGIVSRRRIAPLSAFLLSRSLF